MQKEKASDEECLLLPVFLPKQWKSIFEFGFQELAVQTGNVLDGNALGAFHFASSGIGTISETKLIHFSHHGFGTACCLYLALREQCQL